MTQFNYIIKSPEGIHARPAMLLMQEAKRMSSKISVLYNGKKANAKNVMSLMTLRAFQDAEVTFELEGPDEKDEAEKLREFCEKTV